MVLRGYQAYVHVVSGDPVFIGLARPLLEAARFKVIEGQPTGTAEVPCLVLLDATDRAGLDRLPKLRQAQPEIPVVAVVGDLGAAGEALKNGAFEVMTEPLDSPGILVHRLSALAEADKALQENRRMGEHFEAEVARRTTSLEKEIRERVRAEELLKISLKEKEILVKEIHHRVKNHLQMISSLLSLQSSYIKEAGALALFNESRNRIRAVGLVHEFMFRGGDLSRINFKSYIEALFEHLAASYERRNITLTVTREDLFLNVSTAIPCGIIVNELITNSLVHGLAGKDGGGIEIELRQKGVVGAMTVRDNGRGLPAGLNFRASGTLGFQLVTSLVDQLRGSIDQLAGPGAAFIVQFPAFD